MSTNASKMELGDKEIVAICIQASVTCYLHVIHRCTRMVYKILPYAYGTEHRHNNIIVSVKTLSSV